ncbi:AGE family epimerase/isomerase [Bradyrhizobium australiense]|uniref:Mannose-6-phosphate isomerase n=1 Tax=Bradyrhizobium australiense TaxID=2721161 RepID=A0A7Y4GXD6_9BRAD|nr:AGE family epimerase/isomerase [Bradyrhizobium australiense]NOJ43715.1 mannose-6-phosphate isomerase [Bradyrhizobium australiense]
MNSGQAVQHACDSVDIVKELKALMINHALPLWWREGWDASRGGFVERLDHQGNADYVAPRRIRVQARQIYSYAKAAQLGWYPEGRKIAMEGLEYLLAKAKGPDGQPGFVHLIDRNGSTINPLRDSYDHAFILLALATVYQLTGDASVQEEIRLLWEFLDSHLRSPHGGFIEGIPPALPRRQNPQMHLLEAMIATFDATGDAVFKSCASDLFRIFVAKLYDRQRQILGEYFEEDWLKIEPSVVEPGHQAEWVWLLKGFERITGCPTGEHRSQLLASALRYRDETGCLLDEGDAEGKVRKFTRRLWPQTEIAKAWIAQAEAGEQGAADQAIVALARLDKHYLQHSVRGGWYDQFDCDNQLLVESIPASSFYHVICAIAEANRVLS